MQLKPITVLVSAVGAPGAATLIKQLKAIDERKISIVGVDADHQAAGQFLWCDKFYQVPKASDETEFVLCLRDIIYAEEVDAFLCCSSAEVNVVSHRCEEFKCKTLVSRPDSIAIAENKSKLYMDLQDIVPVPKFQMLDRQNFFSQLSEFDYPKNELCIKPAVSKGGRGVRFLSNKHDKVDLMLNHKPSVAPYMDEWDFLSIFADSESFSGLMVMEKIEGTHYDCMTLCLDGDALLTTVKTRERTRDGIIMHGELVDSPRHVELCAKIVDRLGLSYNIGIQFIGETLIEVNPRPSTFIYADGFCEPYLAIKLALGEIGKDEVRAHQSKVPVGLRMARYFDQVFY